jgi:hypothetical protein
MGRKRTQPSGRRHSTSQGPPSPLVSAQGKSPEECREIIVAGWLAKQGARLQARFMKRVADLCKQGYDAPRARWKAHNELAGQSRGPADRPTAHAKEEEPGSMEPAQPALPPDPDVARFRWSSRTDPGEVWPPAGWASVTHPAECSPEAVEAWLKDQWQVHRMANRQDACNWPSLAKKIEEHTLADVHLLEQHVAAVIRGAKKGERHGLRKVQRLVEAFLGAVGQRPASPTAGQPFVPTPLQKRILDALAGKAMKADKLADAVKVDRRRLFRDGIKELRERGLIKNSRRVGGYYRPNAPPPQFASFLSAAPDPSTETTT